MEKEQITGFLKKTLKKAYKAYLVLTLLSTPLMIHLKTKTYPSVGGALGGGILLGLLLINLIVAILSQAVIFAKKKLEERKATRI